MNIKWGIVKVRIGVCRRCQCSRYFMSKGVEPGPYCSAQGMIP